MKPIGDQIQLLVDRLGLRGNVTGVQALAERPLPDGAEGWFVIPKWQMLASTYEEAMELVFAAIKKSRRDGFHNYREGQLGPKSLRQSEANRLAFEKFAAEEPDRNFVVIPAQFGMRHRGRSVRRAIEVMLDTGGEFGLDAFSVAIMILTHEDRFTRYEDLCIDCAGSEASPDAGGDFSNAPSFFWNDGLLRFGFLWSIEAFDDVGAASGFLSQQQ